MSDEGELCFCLPRDMFQDTILRFEGEFFSLRKIFGSLKVTQMRKINFDLKTCMRTFS